jgi:tryptophan synthase alpha chain
LSRIDALLQNINRTALIGYLTVGYPDIETTLRAASVLADCGCDIIELGIPFSDPLADGTIIQRASFGALQNGVTPQDCLNIAREVRQNVDITLVFMTYFNPVFKYGVNKFCSACNGSGIDGLIVPDLPPEEGSLLETAARNNKIDIIYLLAPSSPQPRILKVVKKSRGFIYLVSVTGVTGVREKLSGDLTKFVARVRKTTDKPLCVGFGISTVEQAQQVARIADGVIIGSRLIELMEADKSLLQLGDFISEVRMGLNNNSSKG